MAQHKIKSEVTGVVGKVLASVGAEVDDSDTLLFVESMKMEIPIMASHAGRVAAIYFGEGDLINEGDVAAMIEA